MDSFEIIEAIKEQLEAMEVDLAKTTSAAKQRCRSCANKIKQLSAEFKKVHK